MVVQKLVDAEVDPAERVKELPRQVDALVWCFIVQSSNDLRAGLSLLSRASLQRHARRARPSI